MPAEELISKPIRGINPFNELPIDAEIWKTAHGQHQIHRELHAAYAHRPGIVYGLEVFAGQAERTVVVMPGIGIDSEGRTLKLSEPFTVTLDEKGQVYITIRYEPTFDSRTAMLVGGGTQYYGLVESRKIEKSRELPRGPYLELVRIDRSTQTSPVKEPANPFDPDSNELNFLYRILAFPHCYADGTVGELVLLPKNDSAGWKPNRAGLWNMLRYGNGLGFHLDFSGPFNLRSAGSGAEEPLLLYAAGADEFEPISDAETEGLRKYLDAGGFFFAEAAGGNEAFERTAAELMRKMGAKLAPVTKGHSLLASHQVFSSPPAGSVDKGKLVADLDRGVVLSTFDYGGAWQGHATERERIRAAQEFGLNLIVCATRRRRKTEALSME